MSNHRAIVRLLRQMWTDGRVSAEQLLSLAAAGRISQPEYLWIVSNADV